GVAMEACLSWPGNREIVSAGMAMNASRRVPGRRNGASGTCRFPAPAFVVQLNPERPTGVPGVQTHQRGGNMSYVDGFVLPVPKKSLAAYRRLARKAGAIWKEHGALEYVECVADDVQPGKHTSFPQSVKLKPGEVVVFSWIVYKSRAQRDRINKKVMADPRLADMDPKSLPFDGKRMFWGGFKPIVEL